MFDSEKYKDIDFMESTPKSRSVGIAHFFKNIFELKFDLTP